MKKEDNNYLEETRNVYVCVGGVGNKSISAPTPIHFQLLVS